MKTKNNMVALPNGFEWCRKGLYEVQAELGCYRITEEHPLLEGFEAVEVEENGEKVLYAVKSGFNVLELNKWTTSPTRPYILTGTVGEQWPVKARNLSAYEVNPESIGVEPMTISTKDPSNQEFMVAFFVPEGTTIKVLPGWAFQEDGTIDERQIMVTNSEQSMVSHMGGDYIVAKHIPGKPEYMELSEEERNTREAAELYDPRVVNGSIMQTTYNHARTQEEVIRQTNEALKNGPKKVLK
jgi:hypothetical protein